MPLCWRVIRSGNLIFILMGVSPNPTGVSSLINLLASAQGEEQPRLNVMLCEAVVAVYLSLLIHGLGTHSANELFRLAAHPLNNRMWAAVFGGGAKLIVKPKRPPDPTPGTVTSPPPAVCLVSDSKKVRIWLPPAASSDLTDVWAWSASDSCV